jgi:hypothetical protein
MGALLIFVGDNCCRKALEKIEDRIAKILKHPGARIQLALIH